MSEYGATIHWERGDARFADNRYSRAHRWRFDGGHEAPASASPLAVPLPFSDPAGVDPEEAFFAAIASCHMLWFLSIAAKQGWIVDRYVDAAVGTLARNAAGQQAMTDVVLRPRIEFGGDRQPSAAEVIELHHAAHATCYIANSVTTTIRIEPTAD